MCDKSKPPQIPELLERLSFYKVAYVLVGSVAAMVYGADVQPGDLDITPALDNANLTKLGGMLESVGAKPDTQFRILETRGG